MGSRWLIFRRTRRWPELYSPPRNKYLLPRRRDGQGELHLSAVSIWDGPRSVTHLDTATGMPPRLSNLDFSAFKTNYVRKISENFNVQFRAEFFNILNRANFAVPVTPDNTDIFDASGDRNGVAGLLTPTTTTAREIQFALKLIW